MMKVHAWCAYFLVAALGIAGCTAEVQPTDDSQRVTVETPKVEVGDEPVDMDPATDEDVDVDTPLPGDR
jgi:hypothetical protein